MDRCLSENEILEAMDTWPKYGCMPDGRFVRLTKENEKDYAPYVHYDDMVKVVKGIPSLDVAPVVHAHWIINPKYSIVCNCSNCGVAVRGGFGENYCFNCGAKMDEEVDDG